MRLKWIKGSEKPKESGVYLTMTMYSEPAILSLPYSAKHGLFNVRDNYGKGELDTALDVDYWAELPGKDLEKLRRGVRRERDMV